MLGGRKIIYSFLILLTGCELYSIEKTTPDTGFFTNENAATFDNIFELIIKPKCLSCHSGASAASGIDLSTWKSMMESSYLPALIEPFDASSSSLLESVRKGRMPLNGKALSSEEVIALQQWVNSGAYQQD